MENEKTINDILEIVTYIKDNAATRTELMEVKTDLTRIKATMVTKDYLDTKLADLRGDLVVLTRKEDTKLKELVEILKQKNVLNEEDVKHILAMEPFPQLAL